MKLLMKTGERRRGGGGKLLQASGAIAMSHEKRASSHALRPARVRKVIESKKRFQQAKCQDRSTNERWAYY